MVSNLWLGVASIIIGYFGKRVINLVQKRKCAGKTPATYYFVGYGNIINVFLPRIPWIFAGHNVEFEAKHKPFAKAGQDIMATFSFVGPQPISIRVADPVAIKHITTSRARFPKPVAAYRLLNVYGENIISTEGDKWKMFRKISAPAFSDRNNRLVWDETVRIVSELFSDVWGDKDSVSVDHAVDVTLPIALLVIGTAGFGKRVSWKEDALAPQGFTHTFKGALHMVSNHTRIKLLVPNWVYRFSKRLDRIRCAFDELELYMKEMIEERIKSEKVERHDLLSALVDSNISEDGGQVMTEDELMGNIFIFLLAGHETTAHTLAFTFALLALYQDEQDRLFIDIQSILADDELPTYSQMPLLTRCMAVFNETLRLFPPVPGIPKFSAEDTILATTDSEGNTVNVPIEKGSACTLAVAAMHYNPKYWKDPHAFNPDRFLDPNWPRDAFLPFSSGARACLGRKFFETEGIAILTMIVSKYKISIKDDPKFAGETFEQKKKRVLQTKYSITLTPVHIPLVFTKRG
ncbi:cytochrome P450 [Coprinopsis marcescibilis]|uniref:Cytochrome P450 n=1 Tax=Coprinopsis marcescibilis TaxID=230819 RepID=A0A5C3L2M9_COPMA|nr:cytochrome P450 [Coprinopsis marcescibilis]